MRPHETAPGAVHRARRRPLLVLALLVAGCAVASALVPHRAHGVTLRGAGVSWRPAALTSRRASPAAPSSSGGGFRIGGSVGALYPGDSAALVLKLTNPQRFAIVVTSISTAVGTPKAGCAAANLTVGAFSGRVRVPARRSAHVSVPVALRHGAPNACQGAVFPLTYSGRAIRR